MGFKEWVDEIRSENGNNANQQISATSGGFNSWANEVKQEYKNFENHKNSLKLELERLTNLTPKDLLEIDRAKSTIPSVHYDENYVKNKERDFELAKLKSDMDEKKSQYDNAERFTLPEKVLNFIGGFSTETLYEEMARKKFEEAAEKYYFAKYGNKETRQILLNQLQATKKEVPENQKETVDTTIKELQNSLYGDYVIDDFLVNSVGAGVAAFDASFSKTLDATLGKALNWLGWENNPINKFNNWMSSGYEYYAENAANAAAAMGGGIYNYVNAFNQGIIGMLPDIVIAMALSKSLTNTPTALKKIANIATNQASMGVIAKFGDNMTRAVSNTFSTAVKNPLYWTSMTRTFGNDYEEAKKGGASEGVAYLYATLTSSMNALVEIGGGVQVLPDKLKKLTKPQILELIISAVEEGNEEVIQSLISDINAKLIYDPNKEMTSAKDLAFEWAVGFGVGVAGGSGTVILDNTVNNRSEYAKVGKIVRKDSNNVEGVIEYASKSSNESIRDIATKNISNPSKISNADLGVLYSYVMQDIDTAFNSATNIENLSEALTSLNTSNETVKNLAFSRYVKRAMELGENINNIEASRNEFIVPSNTAHTSLTETEQEILNTPDEQLTPEQRAVKQNIQERYSSVLRTSSNNDIISNNNSNDIRGENNGEQERLYYGSERSRGEGSNTESRFGEIQADDDGSNGKVQSDGDFGKRPEMLPNQRNNGRIKLTVEQKESLKGTAIKDENGNPKVVSHFTDNMDFETFEKGDIGFHFGNEQQAIERGKNLKKSGRIIKAYLNIKNPLNIPTDLMNWTPFNIAFKLSVEGIITEEDFAKIITLTNEGGSDYNSPAAVELRKILADLGYDGIVYDNMFEADGESYIAFYPEQVIIIDDGRGDNNSSNPDTTDNSEGGGGITSFGGIDTEGGKHLNKAQQDEVRAIGEKLGRKVEFEDFYKLDKFKGKKKIPDGYIDKDGNIHINFYAKRPVYFLFKHEITHYLKRAKFSYQDFMNRVIGSNAFKNWLSDKGYSSIDELKAEIMDTYSEVEGFNEDKCYDEILADFVGERLFGGKNKISQDLINALEPKQRKTFLDVIKDIIEYFKKKFSDNARISSEIESIEKEFIKVYNEAVNVKGNSNSDGEVSYSIKKSTDGHKFVQVENKTISDTDSAKDIATTLSNIIKNKFNDFVNVSGQKIGVNSRTAREWQRSKDAQYLLANEKQKYTDKINAFNNADELLKAARNYIGEEIKHQRSDNFVEFARGIVDFKVDDRGYSADIIVGTTKSGVALLYDIVGLQEIEIEDASHTAQDRRAETSSTDIIDDIEPTVKKNSMQETDDYSIPTNISAESLLEQYENGEITRQEYLDMVKKQKPQNPIEIANLTEEDANTTPHLERKKGKSDGDKTSKFHGSLLGSDIFDNTFKDEIKDNSFIEKYKSVTNKETLQEAAKELDEGGQSYVNKWFSIEPKRASLIDTAVGFILMDRYQRVGDYESATAAAEKVREFGTAGGQQVQIFSILGRLDPNSMVIYAQKELAKAFEIMTKSRTQKWIDKNADKFNLTEEEIEFIRRHTLQAAQLPEGRDKAIRLAEIATLLQDKLPAKKGDGLRALQRMSMLLNFKTNIRNITGNGVMVPVFITSDFFGSGIDRWVSKKTGVRTTGNFDIKSVKGFKKGAFETMDDFRRHINTRNEELNRFDMGSGKAFNENHNGKLAKQMNDCAKVLNALDRFTSFCLEMGDRPFYEMWYINSLNNQMKLNKTSEATPEMVAIASLEALQRTWQDTNKLVQVVAGAKKSLNIVTVGGYGLGDVLIKFTKTPANLTKAIFDFSPAGAFKALAVDGRALKNAIEKGQFEASLQKKFVDSLSKGIAGTLLYVIAAGLASAGLISGDGDDDKDVSNYEKYIQGIPEYSVKLFGKWWSYEWMQPVGAIAATVTDYMKSKEENPDNEWYEDVYQAILSGGEVLYNQSFMRSIQILFSADSVIDGVFEELLNEPSVYIPQVVSQFASATDDYRRVNNENNKPFESALNGVKLKIPGLRQTLEKQVDIFGREVPNSQGNFFNAFINPGNTFTDTSNEVTNELYELYKSTGEKSVMPRVAPYSITVKKKSRPLSVEEKNDFQRISGNTVSEIFEVAIKKDEYKKLSDEEKVEFVKKVIDFSVAYAKSNLEYDYEILSSMVGEKKNGEPILKESVYNRLPEDARKQLAEEYFLSKAEMRYLDDYDKLIRHYISQVKN